MSRKHIVYPQIDLARWSPGNRWQVSLSIDHGGNVTEIWAMHFSPGPTPKSLDDLHSHRADVRPFDDLLAQIRTACIEAAANGVQERLPGMANYE